MILPAPETSRNPGRAPGKSTPAPPRKRRATNAPAASGSFQERQQFRVGVRRLAHALNGVKILQRLHAGQRLRNDRLRDIPGELGAMHGDFVLLNQSVPP